MRRLLEQLHTPDELEASVLERLRPDFKDEYKAAWEDVENFALLLDETETLQRRLELAEIAGRRLSLDIDNLRSAIRAASLIQVAKARTRR